jgi:hypothetical protein
VDVTYAIQSLTVLIKEEFGIGSVVMCDLYDSSQKPMMSAEVWEGKEIPYTVIWESSYFLESGALAQPARDMANIIFSEIDADPKGVQFAVGKKIEQCYYFSPKELEALGKLQEREIILFFNERYRDVTQNSGRTRTWEEACEGKVVPLASQDKIPDSAEERQESDASWKLVAAALTATSLGVALLYFNRTSIQSWLKG